MRVWSASFCPTESHLVAIESTFLKGFSGVQLVGQATEVCKNGIERARAVIEFCGLTLPARRLLLNLAPATGKKDGSQFDLAFAVSFALLTCPDPPQQSVESWLLIGELSLEGELRPVQGAASFALACLGSSLRGLVVAEENRAEIETIFQTQVAPPAVLSFTRFSEVLQWLFESKLPASVVPPLVVLETSQEKAPTFDDMHLDPTLRLAALVIATGRHNLLLWGPPGTGKSMFSARIPSLLPLLPIEELWESLRIHSLTTTHLSASRLEGCPPFRNPHHQASATAILGSCDRPGELALAHGGVLFLDELPEFRRDILEGLREPLETGWVQVARAQHRVAWRAKITLVAACNSCPCGWYGSRKKRCMCPISKIQAYRRRLSGPIVDRIDLHLNMEEKPILPSELFLLSAEKEQTKELAGKVQKAIEFGRSRNRQLGVLYNRDLSSAHILDASGHSPGSFQKLMEGGILSSASPRSIIRALRVARTLADLEEASQIGSHHLEQAVFWQAESASRQRGDAMLGL